MTAPMPETMSPREKVEYDHSLSNEENYRRFKAHVTALASSGDHAGLINELRTRTSVYDMRTGKTRPTDLEVKAADAVEALIAEVAALRAKNDVLEIERLGLRSAIFGSHDYDPSLRHGNFIEMARTTEEARQGALVRATEAERKLAEAVGLLAQARSWAPTTGPLGDKISTFLSKEAERG